MTEFTAALGKLFAQYKYVVFSLPADIGSTYLDT